MKKSTIKKIAIAAAVVLVLALAFWYGGNAPGSRGWKTGEDTASVTDVGSDIAGSADDAAEPSENLPEETDDAEGGQTAAPGSTTVPEGYTEQNGMLINEETGKDQYMTDPVPTGKPAPVEPDNTTVTDVARTCTISIRCDTILKNMSFLKKEKAELVPENGIILPATTVTFYEGESVFNVLQRTCKQNGIHLEFSNTPIYNSAYIEGIANLYEFDCGSQSGWMYKVNDWFPNYGCSRYQLSNNDVIEWVFTCDRGADVGGSNYSSK